MLISAQTTSANEVSAGFDNEYISEGRKQLAQGGIYWLSASHLISEQFSIAFDYGYASSSQVDYDELGIHLQYAGELAGINYSLIYTRMAFIKDNESDDELGIELEFPSTTFDSIALFGTNAELTFTPFANMVFSREQNGFFATAGALATYPLSERFVIHSSLGFSYEFGYSGVDKDGYNHTSLGLELNYQLNQDWSISTFFEKTFASNLLSNEQTGENEFWGGFRITRAW